MKEDWYSHQQLKREGAIGLFTIRISTSVSHCFWFSSPDMFLIVPGCSWFVPGRSWYVPRFFLVVTFFFFFPDLLLVCFWLLWSQWEGEPSNRTVSILKYISDCIVIKTKSYKTPDMKAVHWYYYRTLLSILRFMKSRLAAECMEKELHL